MEKAWANPGICTMVRIFFICSAHFPILLPLLPELHLLLWNSHSIPCLSRQISTHQDLFTSPYTSTIRVGFRIQICQRYEYIAWGRPIRIHCGTYLLKIFGNTLSFLELPNYKNVKLPLFYRCVVLPALKNDEKHQFIEYSLNNSDFLIFREYHQTHLFYSFFFIDYGIKISKYC